MELSKKRERWCVRRKLMATKKLPNAKSTLRPKSVEIDIVVFVCTISRFNFILIHSQTILPVTQICAQ